MNVGIHQVDPIIRSVLLNIAGMEVEKLPKPATLVRMLTELKCLSYQQIADELQDCKTLPCIQMVLPNLDSIMGLSRSQLILQLTHWGCQKC